MRNCWKMRILRTPCASLTRWNPNARISRPMRSRGASAVIPCSRLCTGRTSVPVERGIVRTLFGGKTKVRLAAPAAEAFPAHRRGVEAPARRSRTEQLFFAHLRLLLAAPSPKRTASPHSFGIAVDLNPDKGPYWQWSKLRPHPLQKTFPSAIVSLFEDNGFIWGGKWEHFDLMHFEYRPELIIKAKKLRAQANGEKPEDAS